ncbi:potassium channel family protein [Enterococcus sp. AD013-P3]|uniref:potassium channel family protein n=1 Tax=Enterococcus sp. AD013-P3 TaxID=3411036 RepID=UPI003B941122
MNKKNYNIVIVILAMLSILMVILDFSSVISLAQQPFMTIDNLILIVFAFDYFYRFAKADKKGNFFVANIFDLLAIIPFDAVFSFFRVARIFRIARISRFARLSRLVGVTGKLTKNILTFLNTRNFTKVLYASAVLITLSAALYSYAENAPFIDSFWWALVTVTTVGYGDISPHSPLGKFAAILLMFLGIGFIGLLTSTITDYFNKQDEEKEDDHVQEKLDELLKQMEILQKKIDDLEK